MEAEAEFEADPRSIRAVRRFVREELTGRLRLDDVVLTTSELATNVVRHARTEFAVRLASNGESIRLEVCDGSSIVPAVKELGNRARGLRVVQTVSDRWGVDVTENGKTIWAEFGH